jgi:arginyl-tRNA synthetase
MFRILISESIKSLENAISTLGWEIPDDIRIEEPPNPKFGDIASSVSFQLAKILRKSNLKGLI